VLELLTFSDQLYAVNDLKPLDFQVLRLSAQGAQVKEIAAALNISQRSVYRSREKLKEILDVDSLVELIEAAREQGLLDD
ncbi:MAG: helix-turn-helix domain-containing protein, partial [Anaerolineae bacterium]|nr:helix-turn-helix domain-containing protein [Anaerolineae bacterium]